MKRSNVSEGYFNRKSPENPDKLTGSQQAYRVGTKMAQREFDKPETAAINKKRRERIKNANPSFNSIKAGMRVKSDELRAEKAAEEKKKKKEKSVSEASKAKLARGKKKLFKKAIETGDVEDVKKLRKLSDKLGAKTRSQVSRERIRYTNPD
jgi:hypothetical protein